MRIIIITDSPHIPTGLARVGRELALGLYGHGHDMAYLGLFHHSEIPQANLGPVKCWFTNDNLYGQGVFDRIVNRFQPDAVLTIGDMWNFWHIADHSVCKTRKFFQWVAYLPVDGEPIGGGIPPDQIHILEDVDWPIAYTRYAERALRQSVRDEEFLTRLRVIYHGVDPELYKPISPEEKMAAKERFKVGDKFLFLTVCRNQSRKNIPELLRAWKIMSESPEARGRVMLWPHMFFNDPSGWKIDSLLDIIKLRNDSVIYYEQVAHGEHEMLLLPESEVTVLYQIADAFVLISGEGFGLPTLEAMATGIPCVLLDYAASSELGADGRAEMIPCRDFAPWTGLHLTQRPMPNPTDVAKSMMRVYEDKGWRDYIAANGQKFALENTWERTVSEFNSVFMEMEVPFLKPKVLEIIC